MDTSKFEASIKELSQKCRQYLDKNLDEKKTENWLIEPLIEDLGFDIRSPEVVPEYKAGVRENYDHSVDYALFTSVEDSDPVAIIECKALGGDIDKKDTRMQLREYFQGTASEHTHIALLTNGDRFLFFTDSKQINLMDFDPYWEFNLSDIKDEEIKELESYSKDCIASTVSHLECTIVNINKNRFSKELEESLEQGIVPLWLVEATENELAKNWLNCKKLVPSVRQKLEPEVVDLWNEICKVPKVSSSAFKKDGSGAKKVKQPLSDATVHIEDMITLSSLINSGISSNIKVESYKLGSNPMVAVKGRSMVNLLLSCISDLEVQEGLLSRFGSELSFASKEQKKWFDHPVAQWFINTNTNTKKKLFQLVEALNKVGKDPKDLQLKLSSI